VKDAEILALALDPTRILAAQGLTPDPWQRDLLFSTAPAILLNCSRGAGKSRTTSALALHTGLFQPRSLILLISRSQRQSGELFRYVKQGYNALNRPIKAIKETETQLEFDNRSRIVCLPGKEETIRSFQGVNLLVLDEAARIPDDLFASVSPMTGVSHGRVICLSTPFGQRGWWWKEWFNQAANWQRFRVAWNRCPRLPKTFIDEERRRFGDSWIEQEYECSFTAMEGLVYPNFEEQTKANIIGPPGKHVGGIDFGFRNPFAAVWGTVKDDVLHIDHEIYLRETPLSKIVPKLPKHVLWAADPAGAVEISELRLAGFKVFKGKNDIRAGIAAVTARLQTERLRVNYLNCQNILAEARLYRYPSPSERGAYGENPIDQDNHALAALRYLISRLDARYMSTLRKQTSSSDHAPPETDIDETLESVHQARPIRSINIKDPNLWTPL